jgi:hypothetical protein
LPDLSQRLRDAKPDRYRVERTFGWGGGAAVSFAEDLEHRREVAVGSASAAAAGA